jgi:hypothetical protein
VSERQLELTSSIMKMVWCWRCKTEMPMLDDEEYRQVTSLFYRGQERDLRKKFAPMVAEYARITGLNATNPNAIFHHRISIYGPPCSFCGKPLRTPQAKLCGYCMKPVTQVSS